MSEETKNPGMEPETKETEPEQELEQNPRSRSARLRVAEKL